MEVLRTAAALAVGALSATAALAQSSADLVQRDVRQQARIEQGLESGALNAREAAQREHGAARIDRFESRALRDGTLSDRESEHIDHMQDVQSRAIYREKHDRVLGDPDSPSSRRMQASVQRSVNQEARIAAGLRDNSLDNTEVGRLELGQARTHAMQARFGRDGRVGAREHGRLQASANRQSGRIFAARRH
jgi:hypothetical protein